MTQCLRCSKPCAPTSVFCDECRLLLRYQLQEGEHAFSVASIGTSPLTALSSEDEVGELRVSDDPLERITSPQPIVDAPPTPVVEDVVEQAVHQLNEAAQNIAKVEQAGRRVPHASRLAPIRDISADIRRESTPLPRISKVPEGEQSEDVGSSDAQVEAEANVESEDLGQRLPDLWPWLQDESENDNWTNQTDPLMARHFPSSAESARIEEEDLRRAIAEGLVTRPVPSHRAQSPRMRLAFVALTILAVLALVVDSVLIFIAFTHPHHKINVQSGSPILTLSPNQASVGQTVILHINYFSSLTQVSLTHDIQEALQTTSGSSVVRVGPTGAADVSMVIGSWEPGFHTIVAEDVTTRYTASATLQIINSGSTRPSHLLIDKSALDMGPALQGANTIQFLVLSNSGGGSISWAASSDKPWLLLSPTQGTFSTSQTVAVGVERYNLKAGPYKGKITFSSNVGPPEYVQVEMTVQPLPANVGAVLVVTPVVLSYTAVDGGADPSAQLLMVSNPGSQPLYWSLTSNTPLTSQDSFTPSPNSRMSWLTTDQTSGMVLPHSTNFIRAMVHSHALLPGVYRDALLFTAGPGAKDSPEPVSVSLTVQPHCGLALSTGSISFTAVSGQSNPSNQGLGLWATSSCTGVIKINWHAISSASWLTVTPTSGQLKGAARTVTAVGVNVGGLKPGSYTGTVSVVLTGQSTQTVIVQLTVQAPPPPTAPIIGASPLNINFSTTQGQANPPGQVVTITNNGGSPLHWSTNVIGLASNWLVGSPTGGDIAPGQTGQVTVFVNTSGPPPLTPNTYVGQVVLNGTDANGATASGSPQTITVNLVVLPPCTLAQPSSSSLSFNAVQGGLNPTPQSVMITASGNCAWPLNWHASIPPSWLSLKPPTGSFASSGQSAGIAVAANIAGLTPGTYSAQVSITATDSSGTAAQGSPQMFSVTLTVLQPCSLLVSPSGLSFTVQQGQSAQPQSFSLSEAGSCARPVSWTVTGDAGSTTWLGLSPPSGSDNGGGGTVAVTASATTLQPGTYTGSITVSAIDSNGATVQGSGQTITVTLTVTGSISGVVMACADSSCSTPTPLAGATVLLMSGSTQIASTIADGSGNYSFSNVPAGTYTLSASGTDNSGNHYSGTATITVSGNQTGVTINAIRGSA